MKKVNFDKNISVEYVSEIVDQNSPSSDSIIEHKFNKNVNTDISTDMSPYIYQLVRNSNRKKRRNERLNLNSNEQDYECPTSDHITNKGFNFLFSCFGSISINVFR